LRSGHLFFDVFNPLSGTHFIVIMTIFIVEFL
jgi:hypothetical protein